MNTHWDDITSITSIRAWLREHSKGTTTYLVDSHAIIKIEEAFLTVEARFIALERRLWGLTWLLIMLTVAFALIAWRAGQ